MKSNKEIEELEKRTQHIVDSFMMKGKCLDCGKIGKISKLTCQCEKCMLKEQL